MLLKVVQETLHERGTSGDGERFCSVDRRPADEEVPLVVLDGGVLIVGGHIVLIDAFTFVLVFNGSFIVCLFNVNKNFFTKTFKKKTIYQNTNIGAS